MGKASAVLVGASLVRGVLVALLLASANAAQQTPPEQQAQARPPVDLSGAEVPSLSEPFAPSAASRPSAQQPQQPQQHDWFRKIDVWGYLSAAYLQTQSGGARPGGSLAVDQASLFLNAEVNDGLVGFFEIQTDRFQTNSTFAVRVGEVYAHLRRAVRLQGNEYLGIKVGRFDIPFGETYLLDDSPDNPLIGTGVAHTYDVDEGILAHGTWHGIGFIGSFIDGSADRQSKNEFSKAFTAKVYGDVTRDFYLSGSVLRSGETASSSIYLGGTWLNPVGSMGQSSVGSSSSAGVGLTLAEADARLRAPEVGLLRLCAGHGRLDDEVPAYDRRLFWFSVEPTLHVARDLDATLRYSEIGTYSDTKGYLIDGRPFANAGATHGYDLARLSRLELGLAWRPQPNVIVKGEVGFDRLHAIDASPVADDTRGFAALQFVVRF